MAEKPAQKFNVGDEVYTSYFDNMWLPATVIEVKNNIFGERIYLVKYKCACYDNKWKYEQELTKDKPAQPHELSVVALADGINGVKVYECPKCHFKYSVLIISNDNIFKASAKDFTMCPFCGHVHNLYILNTMEKYGY